MAACPSGHPGIKPGKPPSVTICDNLRQSAGICGQRFLEMQGGVGCLYALQILPPVKPCFSITLRVSTIRRASRAKAA